MIQQKRPVGKEPNRAERIKQNQNSGVLGNLVSDDKQCSDHHCNCNRKDNQPVWNDTCDDIGHERDSCDRDCIRKLCVDVVDMVAVGSG